MSSEDFAPIDFAEIESTQEKELTDKFQQLYTLNLNDKVENKNGLSYLSWANAWAAFKTRILNAMESLDVRTWQTDGMRITRKLPTTRSSFSVADFKSANPDVDLAPYMRLSTVAGSLSIAV